MIRDTVTLNESRDALIIIDQALLPGTCRTVTLRTTEEIIEAIKKLRVRGAPAIGVAAAGGAYLAAKNAMDEQKSKGINDDALFFGKYFEAAAAIGEARPTAVNLRWAIKRMNLVAESFCGRTVNRDRKKLEESIRGKAKPGALTNDVSESGQEDEKLSSNGRKKDIISECGKWFSCSKKSTCLAIREDAEISDVVDALLAEAEKIRNEDIDVCSKIGENGLSLLRDGMTILTHCNAGRLAAVRYGTALAPLYKGAERGMNFHVYADETRPLLQGARLTSFELNEAGIDVTLICDNMASSVMKMGKIDAVITGCDRVAANGDAANKIGTSGVAILASHYGIPFYIAAPTSTIDLSCADGNDIVIEERMGEEIAEMWYSERMAPKGINIYNPAFDVTDASLITSFITEKGVVNGPYHKTLPELLK